jgi:hypothetical protein
MNTFLKSVNTQENQKTAVFTGEGAYHGSSNKEPERIPVLGEKITFPEMKIEFANICHIKDVLRVPSQEEIQNDGVVFVWSSFEEAKREAGPVTKNVLLQMEPHLKHNKKYIYVDSKIQFFRQNDLPVDSKLWHVDGSIAVRGEQAWNAGYMLLHDLKSKITSGVVDNYLAYQSSHHCATQWAIDAVTLSIPERIPSFDLLDTLVQRANPRVRSQPAGSIIRFTDNSLHRAVPASDDGWRLWVRCIETDREVKLNSNIINCYGTVFRTVGIHYK